MCGRAPKSNFVIGVTLKREAVTPGADPLALGRYEPLRQGSMGNSPLTLSVLCSFRPSIMTEPVSMARWAARQVLPARVRGGIRRRYRRLSRPRQIVRLGIPRRLLPVSRDMGMGRGSAIDRYYIEEFLRRHSGASGYAPGAIQGRVLEIGQRHLRAEVRPRRRPHRHSRRVDRESAEHDRRRSYGRGQSCLRTSMTA